MKHKNPVERRFADLRFILRGNKRGLALQAFLALLAAGCETFLLAVVVQSIAAISKGRTELTGLGPTSLSIGIQTLLILAVVAAVGRATFTAVVALLGPRITARSRERLRLALFRSYLEADWATQSSDKTGRFVQSLSGSVNDANTIIALFTQALPATITLAVLISVSLVINPTVTLSIIVVGAAVSFSLRPLSKRALRSARRDLAGRSATAAHVTGVIAAGSEIAVLGSREGVYEIGRRRIHDAERSFARAQGLKRVVGTASQSVAFLFATVGLLVLSSTRPEINFTAVGTITVLLLRCAGLAQQVQTATSQYGTVVPFVEQVRVLIARYRSRRLRFGSEPFPAAFDIAVDDVAYTYEGTSRTAVAVERARFPQGALVAILGPSGSGKSTLMQLILRLRNPTRGRIAIGNVSSSAIDEDAFSRKVAYVPQAPHLVPATIGENIRFYRPHVTDADIVRAARQAHLHEEIERMDLGYDTPLDSHVDALSGGQKQRLALARALATHPAVLVLDEPTSALDTTNEAAVMGTLRELRGTTTVIVVTHKLSTADDCDVVLDLEGGQLRRRDHALARPGASRPPAPGAVTVTP